MTTEEKTAYKKAEIDRTSNYPGQRIDIKGYETDGTKDYVIIDVDPDSDDIDTIIMRRLYTSYGNEYFLYKGMEFYLFNFSRIL